MLSLAAWQGIDEGIIEPFAAKAGRHPWPTLIPGQGNLLLFVLLVAGIIGGFVIGFAWRDLFGGRRDG